MARLDAALDRLVELMTSRRTLVLTGAGCSTESGIPDYRGPGTRARARNPLQYRAFMEHAEVRRRYWARSVVGWPKFAAARPNPGHRALAQLEAAGAVAGVITQNVDRLHQGAGSRMIIELHGALHEVYCLDCGELELRSTVQDRLLALNPKWTEHAGRLAPDGDADLPQELEAGFRVVVCRYCSGILKPHVVFFGETVPRPTVEAAYAMVEQAEALLVVGSSLAVFSGYRFVRAAKARAIPVAIVNLGTTRADPLADIRIEDRIGAVLPRLARRLGAV